MILGSAVSGLNIASSYKTFGAKQPHLNNDAFLTVVGALSAIGGNAAGASSGARFPIRSASSHASACSRRSRASSCSTSAASPRPRLTFLLSTVFMLFCMGGNFAMFPAQTFRMFGANGPAVYSFLFTAFGSAAPPRADPLGEAHGKGRLRARLARPRGPFGGLAHALPRLPLSGRAEQRPSPLQGMCMRR